ncbi:MAG: hypothetical protein KGM44_01935 [bacterium]|nr:hypothetical protein [bacterium]
MRRGAISGTLLVVAVTLALAGCAAKSATASSAAASIANGRAIFQTGKDAGGVQITASPPAMLHRCAACHKADGSGGIHLRGGAVSADLRHAALVTKHAVEIV